MATNTYKFSILIPAYKARFLKETLDSLSRQTYKFFQVIISDDDSPENLLAVCKPFLSDSRFRYRRNVRNIGAENLVDHWNLLLGMCETEYCVMAGDDDVFSPNYLEEMNRLTNEFPDIPILRPRVRKIDEDGDITFVESVIDNDVINADEFLCLWSNRRVSSGIPYYVFNVDCLRSKGGFIKFPYAWYSDDATVTSMIGSQGMVCSKEVVFSFRNSSISISSSNTLNICKAKLKSAELFCHWLSSQNTHLTSEVLNMAINRIRIHSRDMILSRTWSEAVLLSLYSCAFSRLFLPTRWKLSFIKQSILILTR